LYPILEALISIGEIDDNLEFFKSCFRKNYFGGKSIGQILIFDDLLADAFFMDNLPSK